jgi:hypothetical protein
MRTVPAEAIMVAQIIKDSFLHSGKNVVLNRSVTCKHKHGQKGGQGKEMLKGRKSGKERL